MTGGAKNGSAATGRASVAAALESLGSQRSEFKGTISHTVDVGRIGEAVATCKAAGFALISDVMGIDWLDYPDHHGKRFTVVYNLYDPVSNERIFLRVNVDEGESVPTCTDLYRAANFMEREVYDMFGIEFDGHPNLRKLLTPEDLDGHPHRKDFEIGETPTLFNEGRFIDPPSFRAAIVGKESGLTGWKGGARKGVRSEQGDEIVAHETTGQQGGTE